MVIWITGLSGAGKTTLAKEIVRQLATENKEPILLDGDQLREIFIDSTNQAISAHDRSSRLTLALKYSGLARLLSEQGFWVIVATISLFKEVHDWNRKNFQNYYEVFLDTPIEELRKRDSKKIYSRFFGNEISNVAGLDIEVDQPNSPDLLVPFDPDKSVQSLGSKIVSQVKTRFSQNEN